MLSFMFPAAPPGGGVLVFTPRQFADKALMDLARRVYPDTRFVKAGPIPLK